MGITETTIRATLREMAVPVEHKGYEYLVQALLMNTAEPSKSLKIRDIYLELSEKEEVTPRTIESSLSSVVRKTVKSLSKAEFCLYFGSYPEKLGVVDGHMKVASFVFGLSEYLYVDNEVNKY